MMNETTYLCKRCNYKTPLFKDMVRHFRKKIKCKKNVNSYKYSDDELITMSLLPYYNETFSINECEAAELKNSNLIYNNLNDFIDYIDNIFKKKCRECEFCNKSFITILDLRKHIILECYCKKLKEIENNKIKNEIHNTQTINNINTVNNINITNNFFIGIKDPPVPFDKKWDISQINENTQLGIIFNKLMYSALLEELLKNDTNLNVIIDVESQSGIVYKNDVEKYIEMKMNDIIDATMEKLKNQLLEINNNYKNIMLETEFNTHCRRMINKKFIDYTKEKETRQNTVFSISSIFQQKKDDAIEISKQIMN